MKRSGSPPTRNVTSTVHDGTKWHYPDLYDFAGNVLINDVNQGSGRGDLVT